MHTKFTFNPTFTIGIICLLAFNLWQTSPAFSDEAFSNKAGQVSLDEAIQTALRENPELNAIREKLKVARARIDGIALLGNPELETEFAGRDKRQSRTRTHPTVPTRWTTRTSKTNCKNPSRKGER